MADKSAPPPFTAGLPLSASEQRDKLIKDIIQKERAEADAKTARLRKLRLARDAELAAQPKPEENRKKPESKRKR
jgi:hypothetical protein